MDEFELDLYLEASYRSSYGREYPFFGGNRFSDEAASTVCSDSTNMEADYISRYPQ